MKNEPEILGQTQEGYNIYGYDDDGNPITNKLALYYKTDKWIEYCKYSHRYYRRNRDPKKLAEYNRRWAEKKKNEDILLKILGELEHAQGKEIRNRDRK